MKWCNLISIIMLWFRPNCLGSGRWRKVRGQSAGNGFSFHGLIPPKLQQLQSGEEVDAPGGKSILTMSPRRRLEKCAYDGWERTERVWDSWGRGSFSSGNSELIWEKAWMFFSLDDYSFRSRESFSKNQIVSQQLSKDLIRKHLFHSRGFRTFRGKLSLMHELP